MSNNILKNTMVEMTYSEVEQLAKQNAVVLLPIGVIEEHGRHLPLGTDIYLAVAQAEDIASEMKDNGFPCVIAPPFYWGAISVITKNFSGSFTSKTETIKAVLNDILESLENSGFSRVLFINAHGDPKHRVAITEALKEYNNSHSLNARWLTFDENMQWEGFNDNENYILPVSLYPFDKMISMSEPPTDSFDVHAGAFETAVMRDIFHELTDMETAKMLKPTILNSEQIQQWLSGEKQFTSLLSDDHVGDPAGSQFMKTDVASANKAIAIQVNLSPNIINITNINNP